MIKLSICIPTYNRSKHLKNCLASIAANESEFLNQIEICISDNGSTDDTEKVVQEAKQFLSIKYQKNETNLGIPRNFLKVVNMAEGEFAWLIGDDDLLFPYTIQRVLELIHCQTSVDYFYINSAHLTTEYVFGFPQPFSTKDLPENMQPFSPYKKSGVMPFLDLINPEISFDFLGGMFLAVFRRELWLKNQHRLDRSVIEDMRTFSHFDNTFPHIKIFAHAFAKSKAYFEPTPLSICLTGAREWSPMYPLIHSVRLVEALVEYRRNGLKLWTYLVCRNYALNNFISDMGAMYYYREKSGYDYINPMREYIKNMFYPNTYLSLFYFLFRKLKSALGLRL